MQNTYGSGRGKLAADVAAYRSIGEDLLQILTWLTDQNMGVVAAVLSGMRSDPELAAAMRGRLQRDKRR
jgi:hypothetical protein